MSVKQLEILEMIAKGGMAEVYRARTTGPQGFEKEVCVKKILPHLTEDESFVTMFLDEAKLAAALNSANIVQVHDLCTSGHGEYFIVMEFVDGKDLADIIRAAQIAGRQVPAPMAVHIIREVCQGLAYAHSRTDRNGAPLNIIHRDMSPHNVMVSFLGEVKILDFGIAKASSSMNRTEVGLLKGKYGYMSPEQARGRPLDARSDIFNTGIVLYELLVGERCFAGSSDFSTLNLMRDATVTPPRTIQPGIPEGLERILLQTLDKDREKRPQSALDLEKTLGDWAASEGQIATKSDLARFAQELFQDEAQPSAPEVGAGFLEVKSVVAEMPLSEPPPVPKRATAVAPSLALRPVEAPPAAKADGGPDASPKPETAPARPPAADPVLDATSEAEAPTAKPEPAPAAASEAKGGARAEVSPAPAPGSAQAASVGSASVGSAPAGAASAAPAPDAAPASEKPAGASAAKKRAKAKGKKKTPAGPKVPVGRKHLRPGLAAAGQASSRPPRRTAFTLAAVAIVFGLTGVALGRFRARAASQEHPFREAERDSSGGNPTLGLILISSEPPGLEVEVQGERLLHPTPVAVAQIRPSPPVAIALFRDGELAHEGSVDLEEQRAAMFSAELEAPAPPAENTPRSTLLVHAAEATLRVDGRRAALDAPLALEPGTPHEIEIRRKKRRRTLRVTLAEDERRELFVD